jgi:hypothetical protein
MHHAAELKKNSDARKKKKGKIELPLVSRFVGGGR